MILFYRIYSLIIVPIYLKITKSWGTLIKYKLETLGFANLWEAENINMNLFPMIQRRIRDNYMQDWHAAINDSPKFKYYAMFKEKFEFESYLDDIRSIKFIGKSPSSLWPFTGLYIIYGQDTVMFYTVLTKYLSENLKYINTCR